MKRIRTLITDNGNSPDHRKGLRYWKPADLKKELLVKKSILIILIIMLGGCATVQQPSNDMRDRMDSVRIGMTHQEVENLIGKPTSVTKTDTNLGRLETCNYAVGTLNTSNSVSHSLASSANEKISMAVVYNNGKVLRVQRYYNNHAVTDTAPRHDNLKPNAGVHVNKNMEVTGVDVNSPAYKAGLKIHDIILAFDGTNVSDTAALKKLTAAVAFGDRKVVRIQRGSKILNLTICY
jgi:membrane-associated protease RseP (regulator of RpoE activity)